MDKVNLGSIVQGGRTYVNGRINTNNPTESVFGLPTE